MNINPYQVSWVVVQTEKPLTSAQKEKLQKQFITIHADNVVMDHRANPESAAKRQQEIIKMIGGSGVSVIITDKQFGMTANKWGTDQQPEVDSLFHKKIEAVSPSMRSTIPVTSMQWANRVQF